MATLSVASSAVALCYSEPESFSGKTFAVLGASVAACFLTEGICRVINKVAYALEQRGIEQDLANLEQLSRKFDPPFLSAPKLSLSSKRPLQIVELPLTPSETGAKLNRLARQWHMISCEKRLEKAVSEQARTVFSDLIAVAEGIDVCTKDFELWIACGSKRIFICQDEHLKEIQAIAFVHMWHGECTITHLMTHPRNVRSPVNEEETTRVEGAGSALMHYLIATLSVDKILLISLRSSILFYKKLGFKESGRISPDGSCTPMYLSIKKTTLLHALQDLEPEQVLKIEPDLPRYPHQPESPRFGRKACC